MSALLAGGLSLLGVILGALLFRPQPRPPYVPQIVNTTPPAVSEEER